MGLSPFPQGASPKDIRALRALAALGFLFCQGTCKETGRYLYGHMTGKRQRGGRH